MQTSDQMPPFSQAYDPLLDVMDLYPSMLVAYELNPPPRVLRSAPAAPPDIEKLLPWVALEHPQKAARFNSAAVADAFGVKLNGRRKKKWQKQ